MFGEYLSPFLAVSFDQIASSCWCSERWTVAGSLCEAVFDYRELGSISDEFIQKVHSPARGRIYTVSTGATTS